MILDEHRRRRFSPLLGALGQPISPKRFSRARPLDKLPSHVRTGLVRHRLHPDGGRLPTSLRLNRTLTSLSCDAHASSSGQRYLRTQLRALAGRWQVRWLAQDVQVVLNDRLRVALARARPDERVIEVSQRFLGLPRRQQREVICHEAAHLVVWRQHRKAARPHGPEWSALLWSAGYRASVTIPTEGTAAAPTAPVRVQPLVFAFEHRCPVCHYSRISKHPVHRWRCRACIEAGLPGRMLIRRVAQRDTA